MALFSFTRLALGRRGFSATTKLRGLSWTPELEHYVDDVGVCESKHCAALRSRSFESMSQRQAAMQVSPLQGQFLAHMVRTMNARRVLELGTFCGYSTLWLAEAVSKNVREPTSSATATILPERPQDQHSLPRTIAHLSHDKPIVLTVDAHSTWVDRVGKEFWKSANVDELIHFHEGDALETMKALVEESNNVSSTSTKHLFDFLFVDAGKRQLVELYELALRLVRPDRGVVCIDNTLYKGSVAGAVGAARSVQSGATSAGDTSAAVAAGSAREAKAKKRELETVECIRMLNRRIKSDAEAGKVSFSLLPVDDGFTLVTRLL